MSKRKLISSILTILVINGYSQVNQAKKIQIIEGSQIENILVSYQNYDIGGNTSVDNDSTFSFKWSGKAVDKSGGFGYFNKDNVEIPYIKRKRDLGQTFMYTGNKPAKISSLVIRTGFGSNVVRKHMYGKAISLQFFKVQGEPKVRTNGSGEGIKAFHGFPHNRNKKNIPANRDDYFIGETFNHLAVIRGYIFPSKSDFGFKDTDEIAPNHSNLKGKLLRFTLDDKELITLHPNETYAFLIMIDDLSPGVGFTLANNYEGHYLHGHGIRREGKGVFPPIPADINYSINHSKNSIQLNSSRLPDNFQTRLQLKPSSDGYPDVDTWRDLNFFIEGILDN